MRRTLAGLGGIGLAVALSQFPEYAQQYTQRLGGAVDELKAIVERFDQDAAQGGLDRQTALARYEASPDQFLSNQGTSMAGTIARYDTLSQTLTRISQADPVQRAMSLPDYLDSDIGKRTLEAFKPAVPVTFEGFAYAAAGLLIGYLLVSALWRFFALPFKAIARRRYPAYRSYR